MVHFLFSSLTAKYFCVKLKDGHFQGIFFFSKKNLPAEKQSKNFVNKILFYKRFE